MPSQSLVIKYKVMLSCKAEYAAHWYMVTISWEDNSWWGFVGSPVYIKKDAYEAFKVYIVPTVWAVDGSNQETTLSHEEWSIAISSIMALEYRSNMWKMQTFIEAIWWEEKVIESRKSIFRQMYSN